MLSSIFFGDRSVFFAVLLSTTPLSRSLRLAVCAEALTITGCRCSAFSAPISTFLSGRLKLSDHWTFTSTADLSPFEVFSGAHHCSFSSFDTILMQSNDSCLLFMEITGENNDFNHICSMVKEVVLRIGMKSWFLKISHWNLHNTLQHHARCFEDFHVTTSNFTICLGDFMSLVKGYLKNCTFLGVLFLNHVTFSLHFTRCVFINQRHSPISWKLVFK